MILYRCVVEKFECTFGLSKGARSKGQGNGKGNVKWCKHKVQNIYCYVTGVLSHVSKAIQL